MLIKLENIWWNDQSVKSVVGRTLA